MKRVSIYFLTFLTFWMSSWRVTDIHDWSIANTNQPHPVFSVQQTQHDSDRHITTQDHPSHCGVCIYDHGGHMGQSLASSDFIAKSLVVKNTINSLLPISSWYSRNTLPNLRPPIT